MRDNTNDDKNDDKNDDTNSSDTVSTLVNAPMNAPIDAPMNPKAGTSSINSSANDAANAGSTSSVPLLAVDRLGVEFDTQRGRVRVIENLSFCLEPGRTLGIVGESGSGKSVTSLALMGLLPSSAHVFSGQILFNQRDLLSARESEMRALRGGKMAMIFQDPMTSLNPSFTVGFQIREVLSAHGVGGDHHVRSVELLRQVGIPEPELRLRSYPHELSGGMAQRVMIAMAIACSPQLLIADEPTTALDVTIQAQILALLKRLQKEHKMGLVLITHDIGVVAQMADDILVMYAGQPMEYGPADALIRFPQHPYTRALLASRPSAHDGKPFRSRLMALPGLVPDLFRRPLGCQMHPRCADADDRCRTEAPEFSLLADRRVKCHKPLSIPTTAGERSGAARVGE